MKQSEYNRKTASLFSALFAQLSGWGVLLLMVIYTLSGCGTARKPSSEQTPPPQPNHEQTSEETSPIEPGDIPDTHREMRGAWIATVANIDWPSAPGLPSAEQKAELRSLLERAAQLNMNAVFLQVRPAADAIYDSSTEPWSYFLTGEQGRPTKPFYDPLAYAVQEAHRRGLELHAWFNPFRAYHYEAPEVFDDSHISRRKPDWVKSYGRYWWIDPGRKEARDYAKSVMLDVARRYDIDGVHLDDYFYPYSEKSSNGGDLPFPDEDTYRAYLQRHPPITKDDWRRLNINKFVETLSNDLKKVKPHLLFGISPFGIWRPGHPAQIIGFDAYASLYADARKWFNEGWVDYLAPQLYWPIDKPAQSFPVLLEWWQEQNTYGRHLWPGLYTSRTGRSWNADEIIRQIERTRWQPGASGHIHFSMQAIMNNSGDIAEQLLADAYPDPALIPASPWLSQQPPEQSQAVIKRTGNHFRIQLNPVDSASVHRWVIKTRYGKNWISDIKPGNRKSITIPAMMGEKPLQVVSVAAVGRTGMESKEQILFPD